MACAGGEVRERERKERDGAPLSMTGETLASGVRESGYRGG